MKKLIFSILLLFSAIEGAVILPCRPAKNNVTLPPLPYRVKRLPAVYVAPPCAPIAQPRREQYDLIPQDEPFMEPAVTLPAAPTNEMFYCAPHLRRRRAMESELHDLFMSNPMPQVNPPDPKVYESFGRYSTWPDRSY